MKEREPTTTKLWISPRDLWVRHLLAKPSFVLAATLGVELLGGSTLVILVPAAALWAVGIARCLRGDRTLLRQRLGSLAVVALLILLLRPSIPERVPDDLAEELFRDLLTDAKDRTYYLRVDGEDPSEALLHRLSDLGFRLKRSSRAVTGELRFGKGFQRSHRTRNNVWDRYTGEFGTILSVRNLTRRSFFSVFTLEVDVSSYTGMLNAYGERTLVARFWGWRKLWTYQVWIS